MNSDAPSAAARRPYRQTARAAAAEATAARIVEAFRRWLDDHWFDEIRLEDVARDAGVTVQTVIRRFGGKEGLLEAVSAQMDLEVRTRRRVSTADIASIVRAVAADYEIQGDMMMRMLAQEDRYAPIKSLTDYGRAQHRALVAEWFAATLDPLPPEAARRRLDALVVALDLYVWKLIRRDMARPVAELEALMAQMVQAALSA